jgi:hypothetical protein
MFQSLRLSLGLAHRQPRVATRDLRHVLGAGVDNARELFLAGTDRVLLKVGWYDQHLQ